MTGDNETDVGIENSPDAKGAGRDQYNFENKINVSEPEKLYDLINKYREENSTNNMNLMEEMKKRHRAEKQLLKYQMKYGILDDDEDIS